MKRVVYDDAQADLWLRRQLVYPRTIREMKNAAAASGMDVDTLKAAAERIGVVRYRRGRTSYWKLRLSVVPS